MPFLPAIGGIVRAGKMLDKALDAGRVVDTGVDAGRIARGFDYEVRNADELQSLLTVIGTNKVRVKALDDIPVYRLYKGHDGPWREVARSIHGGSWSTIDPRTMSKEVFLNLHGVPTGKNPANFLALGRVKAGEVFEFRAALPFESFAGGGPDILNRFSSVDIFDWAIPYP